MNSAAKTMAVPKVWVVVVAFLTLSTVILVTWLNRVKLDTEVVRIDVGDAVLEGTLYSAAPTKGRLPTIVVLHGSGPDDRQNPYYRTLAKTFARAGFATFVYDKRGCGNSTGRWIAAPFQRLIADAVKVVGRLREMPQVDPKRIVVWGGSEGASIAPEVAVRSRARGVIAQSASGVAFWKQNRFQNIQYLRRIGLSESAIQKELSVHEAAMHYARTGKDWTRLEIMGLDFPSQIPRMILGGAGIAQNLTMNLLLGCAS